MEKRSVPFYFSYKKSFCFNAYQALQTPSHKHFPLQSALPYISIDPNKTSKLHMSYTVQSNNSNLLEALTLNVKFKILRLHSIQSQEKISKKKLLEFLAVLADFGSTSPFGCWEFSSRIHTNAQILRRPTSKQTFL